ncbi:MAG: hypothetical protein NXY57DRAFT_965904 [Lentinula lateritia]|nr:MAG: hypothetical protein NXY57DRAFT_965904 [Lentinula lateritia]
MSDVRSYTTLRPFPSPSPTAPSPAPVPPLPSPPHLLLHLPPFPVPLPPSLFRDPLLRRYPLPFFASSAIPTARPLEAQGVSSSSSQHSSPANPTSGSCVNVIELPGSLRQPGACWSGWSRRIASPLAGVRSTNTPASGKRSSLSCIVRRVPFRRHHRRRRPGVRPRASKKKSDNYLVIVNEERTWALALPFSLLFFKISTTGLRGETDTSLGELPPPLAVRLDEPTLAPPALPSSSLLLVWQFFPLRPSSLPPPPSLPSPSPRVPAPSGLFRPRRLLHPPGLPRQSQLAASQRENSSLTTAFLDTSHALEAHQWEVKQLQTSNQEVLQHEIEYCSVLDHFNALDRALSGLTGQTVFQRFQTFEEELCVAKKDRDVAVGELATASHKSSELITALMQQQGLIDETNALATRECHRSEKLWEEVHRTRDCAAFVKQMIKEYSDEEANEDLRRITIFAHRLCRSDPATVLHHHSCYIGAIIEAVVAFLQCGLSSDDPDVIAHNFRLALDYMQPARARRFWAPPGGSLEPPLYHCMLALSTAFPHHDGAGRWDDVVPAIPSLDQSTIVWKRLMLEYLHHITDTPMSVLVPLDKPTSIVGERVPSPPALSPVPLFLPEQESPTSPSPPPPSPSLPPLFGSVENLTIDLTGDDDDLYEPEDSHHTWGSEADVMGAVPKEEPL